MKLRREAGPARASLLLPTIAGIAAAVATLILTLRVPVPAMVVVQERVPVPVPIVVPRLVLVPVPALATPRVPLKVGGRIEHVAASANARVIALATRDRVWVSRDGGASFAPALAGKGEVSELFVDRGGTVYAKRPDAIGLAVAGEPERWLPQPKLDGRLLDADGGVFLGVQWDEGAVMDEAGGLAWINLLAVAEWNVIAGKVITEGDARLIVSQRLGEHAWSGPEVHLAGTSGDQVVWRSAYHDSVGFERSSTPCAAIAGDTAWIVQRDPQPDRDRSLPGQLLAIDDRGQAVRVPIDLDLDAARVTCSIIGTARATYASFSIDGGATRLYRLSAATRDATDLDGDPFELRAVDDGGHALGLRGGDLVRRADDGGLEILARGR